MDTAERKELEKSFLRAAQGGDLDAVRKLHLMCPTILEARSSSKGYSAMHFAAMGGAISVCEWLAQQGMEPDIEAPGSVTPMKVALEYKRMPTARRLQHRCICRRSSRDTGLCQ